MTDLAQLVDTYYRSVNELANSLEQSLPVLTQGPSIQDLESISDYLNAVEKILSQVHQSIHDRLGIPVPAKSAQQTLLRGDLRFLINAYYRNGTELVTSLRRDLPVLASGASIELLDKIDRSIYQAAQMISGLTRQVHEVLEANLLDREVLRYRFVLAMSEVASKGEDARTSYEAKNILERWLLNLANDKDPSAPDPIFSVGKLADNYPATEKMRAEFREKKIDPERRVPQILKLGREYLTVTQVPKTSKCRVDGRKISVAEFSFTYPEDRVQLLLSKAPAPLICPMVVRYACLLPRGQQWATPSAVYEYLVTNYGVSVEGFASPLNSRIITLSQPGLGFCSLFPDTDAPFGSLGDFFQADFTGRSVMANPPFVPAVMDRMAQKIEDQINRGGSVRFFVVVPEWTDAQFYLDMMKSPHRLFDFQLPGNRYYYVDLDGDRISVKFNSHFFVLGTPDHRGDYSRLRDDLFRIYEQ